MRCRASARVPGGAGGTGRARGRAGRANVQCKSSPPSPVRLALRRGGLADAGGAASPGASTARSSPSCDRLVVVRLPRCTALRWPHGIPSARSIYTPPSPGPGARRRRRALGGTVPRRRPGRRLGRIVHLVKERIARGAGRGAKGAPLGGGGAETAGAGGWTAAAAAAAERGRGPPPTVDLGLAVRPGRSHPAPREELLAGGGGGRCVGD